MNLGSIIFIAVVLIMDQVFKKKFPQFYKRIELPLIAVMSILVTAYCGRLIYALYDVLTSGVSHSDKIFFAIFIGVIVSVYMGMVITAWIQWSKERT